MAQIGTDLSKAVRILAAGELVAIPTETVYGLAGNALNPAAVARIFATKNRPEFDPLIVHVPSLTDAARWTRDIPEKAGTLARLFWPGPLTLLLEKQPIIPHLVTAGLDTVGVRSPRHPLTHELLRRLDFPLAAPSANPFGYVSPTTPDHVNDQLGDRISYILDGGACPVGIESTIVGFEGGTVTIHRLGGLEIEEIEQAVGRVSFVTDAGDRPSAPGQSKSHYSPRKRLILGDLPTLLRQHPGASALAFRTRPEGLPENQCIILSPSGNLEEAAQRLFSSLRELDKTNATLILAEEVPDTGIGRAINDRLRKAAARS